MFYLFLFAFHQAVVAAESPEKLPAMILHIEGEGIAHVRKKAGMIEAAGIQGKLYPGDRLQTDEKSVVSILLNDGTILKAGFNTELRLDRSSLENSIIAWEFTLNSGSLRVLAEPLPCRNAHLVVHSASGETVASRADFVVFAGTSSESSSTSSLFVLRGQVEAGKAGCDANHTCKPIVAGQSRTFSSKGESDLVEGGFYPSLFASNAAEKEKMSRISLFHEVAQIRSPLAVGDQVSLAKLAADSVSKMARAQDRAIGRSSIAMEALSPSACKEALEAAAELRASLLGEEETCQGEELLAQYSNAQLGVGRALIRAYATFRNHVVSIECNRLCRVKKVCFSSALPARSAALKAACREFKEKEGGLKQILLILKVLEADDCDPEKVAKESITQKKTRQRLNPDCQVRNAREQMEASAEPIVKSYSEEMKRKTGDAKTNTSDSLRPFSGADLSCKTLVRKTPVRRVGAAGETEANRVSGAQSGSDIRSEAKEGLGSQGAGFELGDRREEIKADTKARSRSK